MADKLATIHLITLDADFTGRLNASAGQEKVPGDPVAWVWQHRYQLASAPTWAEKVDYWLASNPDAGQEGGPPANGWALDPAVISDLDITSQTQAILASEGTEEG